MNIKIIWEISKNNPALARALEIGMYAVAGYILSVLSWWLDFSFQAVISAFSVPLLAYIWKRQRDLKGDDNDIKRDSQKNSKTWKKD